MGEGGGNVGAFSDDAFSPFPQCHVPGAAAVDQEDSHLHGVFNLEGAAVDQEDSHLHGVHILFVDMIDSSFSLHAGYFLPAAEMSTGCSPSRLVISSSYLA